MANNILFICYWSIADGLTVSTVLPSLKVLSKFPEIKKILFVTIEREQESVIQDNIQSLIKVKHIPLIPVKRGFNLLTKINDFLFFPNQLVSLVESEHINTILAHGAPAGALAYKVWSKTKIPFYVSSFEPHSDYMAETKTWRKGGVKYLFQKHWEEQQKKHASGLMPVAYNYEKELLGEDISAEKIFTVPCSAEMCSFKFDKQQRGKVREQLKWQDAIIGIYIGKYGGLYMEDDAFQIYNQCFKIIPNLRLIILSPQTEDYIQKKLAEHQLDRSKVFVASVPHHQVPAYLSAADLAFATIKLYPSARYCSPVKIGEYWANGLPVLLTEGVSDDSDIINTEGGGATFNLQQSGSLEKALGEIQHILKDSAHRQKISKLAQKYRSPDKIREAYEYFFRKEKA